MIAHVVAAAAYMRIDVLASEQKISFPRVEIVDGVRNEGRQDRAEESSCAGQTGDQ
jgi:hypothetical protein